MPFPNAPKLYLNEHLPPRLAVQLQRHGFDARSSQSVHMLSQTDSAQLAFAASEHRAIVTFNCGDFVLLHEKYIQQGKEHWGIILSTQETVGILLHRLLRLLNSVPADGLKNQIRWLNEFK